MIIMWKFGLKIAKTESKDICWKYAFWIIAAYGVCMGLRFGRDIDYNILYDHYYSIGENFTNPIVAYEPFFKCICWTLCKLSIPYSGFILLCALLMMSSIVHICINHYRELTPWIVIISLFEVHNAELLIRYFLAFSFLIFALSYYKSNKFKTALFFCVSACLTHTGMVPIVVVSIGLLFYNKLILSPIIVVALMFFSLFFANVDILTYLTPIVNMFGINDKAVSYISSFENMISGDTKLGLLGGNSFIGSIAIMIKFSMPILLSKELIRSGYLKPFECNMFYIGKIIQPVFCKVEILNRIADVFSFFSVFVCGAFIVYTLSRIKRMPQIERFVFYGIVFLLVWPAFSNILFRDEWWNMLYIWDAGDWDTIPLYYFLKDVDF